MILPKGDKAPIDQQFVKNHMILGIELENFRLKILLVA